MPLTLRVPKFIYTIKGYIYNLRHFLQDNPIGGTYRILYSDFGPIQEFLVRIRQNIT